MLFVGITFQDDGFVGSRNLAAPTHVDPVGFPEHAQSAANYLRREFGIWFDRILAIENDQVKHDWALDTDYVTDVNVKFLASYTGPTHG